MAIADKLTQLQTDITSAYTTIASKGGTIPSDKNTNNLSTAINSIPSGPAPEVVSKDVNFYDYDGTRLYSYTQSEFAQLQSLPANPSHEGLTAQGWNWTLSNAQTYVAKYRELDIGQQYKTDDGSTRYYIEFKDDVYKSFTFKITSTDDVTIDWGDNSTSTVLAGTDVEGTHTYSSIGKYCISISTNGTITMKNTFVPNKRDQAIVYKIELSETLEFDYSDQMFYDYGYLKAIIIPPYQTPVLVSSRTNFLSTCRSLEYLTIPSGNTTIPNNFVNGCSSLKAISFPQTCTNITNYVFNNCTILSRITLPELNYLGSGNATFQYCAGLNRLTIPSTLSTITANVFKDARFVWLFDFTNHQSVPTLNNVNAFSNIYVDYKIVVPDSLYSTWITKNNWNNSNIVNHIISKTNYYGS